jgi:hypothetical protein
MKPQELHPLFVRRCPHRNKDANQSRCIQSRVTVPVRMNLLVNVIFHPSPKPEAPRLLLYPYTPTTVLIHSNPAAKILTSLSDRPRRYILPRFNSPFLNSRAEATFNKNFHSPRLRAGVWVFCHASGTPSNRFNPLDYIQLHTHIMDGSQPQHRDGCYAGLGIRRLCRRRSCNALCRSGAAAVRIWCRFDSHTGSGGYDGDCMF